MQTIFEDDHYIVRVSNGTGQQSVIVVSFTGISAPERHDGTCFGHALAVKLHIPWVGIIAKHNCWYRDGDFETAFTAAKVWVEQRKNTLESATVDVVGYGTSMGAYAVVKYSGFFKFDYGFAMAPQWSLDPNESPDRSYLKAFYRPVMANMGVKRGDVSGKIYLFYDPFEVPDVNEIRHFKNEIEAFAFPVCYAGHMVAARIKGSVSFQRLLDYRTKPASLKNYVSRIRRLSLDHLGDLVRKGLRRHPLLTYKAITSAALSQSSVRRAFYEREKILIGELARTLYTKKYYGQARKVFKEMNGNFIVLNIVHYVMSWMGEIVCFDSKNNTFLQTERHVASRGAPMVIHDDRLFALAPAGLIPVEVEIVRVDSAFLIRSGGKFLRARPDGTVDLVEEAKGWETFYEYSPL